MKLRVFLFFLVPLILSGGQAEVSPIFLYPQRLVKGQCSVLKLDFPSRPEVIIDGKEIGVYPVQDYYLAFLVFDIQDSRKKIVLNITHKNQRFRYFLKLKEFDSRHRVLRIPWKKRSYTGKKAQKKSRRFNRLVHRVRKKIQPEFYIENEFMLPVRGMKKEKLYFGDLRKIRIGGRNGGHYYHRGIDYGAPTGTRVYASNAGKIVLARRLFKRGKTVILNHGGGISTEYLHLSRIHVKAGQMVKKGQVIGRVGNTGISTGPHLHWSFVVNGILVNPLPFIETSVASLFGSFPVSSIAEKRGRTGAGKAN